MPQGPNRSSNTAPARALAFVPVPDPSSSVPANLYCSCSRDPAFATVCAIEIGSHPLLIPYPLQGMYADQGCLFDPQLVLQSVTGSTPPNTLVASLIHSVAYLLTERSPRSRANVQTPLPVMCSCTKCRQLPQNVALHEQNHTQDSLQWTNITSCKPLILQVLSCSFRYFKSWY